MTTVELKNELHQIIEDLEDADILDVYDYLHTRQTEDIAPIDELNESQQIRLQASIEQAKNGQVVSHEAFKNRFSKWITK